MASVVVVGGGLAGLACAWKLGRAGHDVEVLERRAAPEPAEGPGFRLDHGAGALREGDGNLRAAAAVLGVAWQPARIDGEALVRRGRFEPAPASGLRGWLREPGGSRERRLRGWRELLAPARDLDPWRPAAAELHDAGWLAATLERVLGDDPLAGRLLASAALELGVSDAEVSHAAGLLALRRRAAGGGPGFFVGGLGELRRRLECAVVLRRGCEVFAVETEDAGALVRYRTQGRLRSVLADAAVVALRGPDVPGLCAKLAPEERGFFESLERRADRTVQLLLEAPPLRLRWLRVGFSAPDAVLRSLVAAQLAPGAAAPGRGLLVARLSDAACRRLRGASDAQWCEAVLEALADTPIGRVRPLASHVSGPASIPHFGPGALARLARFERRLERTPRLVFAAADLLAPGPEAAFTSGLRAATELARGLPAPRG